MWEEEDSNLRTPKGADFYDLYKPLDYVITLH